MDQIKKSKKGYLIAGVLGIIVLLTAVFGFWDQFEKAFYDTCFHIRGEKNPGDEIVIIAMDEKSMKELGPLPWDRSIHARLLKQLDTAKAVGFDILFDTSTDSEQDQSFAKAIKNNGNVILASMFTFEKQEDGNWYQSLIKPMNEFNDAAKGTGFINIPSDKNIIRNATLFDTKAYGVPYPSFDMALYIDSKGKEITDLKISDNKIAVNNSTIYITNSNQAMIDFWGAGGTFPTYSYVDVLNDKMSKEVFQNKIVLIGIATPTEKSDYYDNPYTSENLVLKGTLPVPGVEIHASAIKTYLEERSFRCASDMFNILFLVLVFFLAVFLIRKSSYLLSFPIIIGFVMTIGLLSYLLWSQFHFVINTIAPIAMIVIVFVAITTENLVSSEAERRNTRMMFSRYVSSTVVDKLLEKGSINIKDSAAQEVTILFADIRNFTTYSEYRTPEEVVSRLNYYFKEMTEIIFRHGGTLDKYIGDCIMAVFGAPIPSAEHAKSAVKAAIEMKAQLEEMNKVFVDRGEEPMNIGIGINSGNVIAGSIGSKIRMEYTVIGDGVNLASRLESLSKEYDNNIMLGKSTVEQLGTMDIPNWELCSLGTKSIKGLTKQVEVFLLKKPN